jgi:hypothetical protein
MMRRTPLRRSRNREPRPAKQIDYTPRPRATAVARADAPALACVPVPKQNPARDKPYLRLVASLPCCWCGAHGRSQAAHANQGKGMGIKASDASAFPLCTDGFSERGCHSRLDQSGTLTKEVRRELEELWGNQTRMKLRALANTDAKVRAIVERVIGL